MKVDVAVVGGGVAGTIAALRARAAGRSAVVLSAAWGASALTSGVFGVACQPATGRVLSGRDAVRALVERSPWHPYARFADPAQAIDEAIRFFCAGPASLHVVGESPGGEPLVLANDCGALCFADLALASYGRGDFRRGFGIGVGLGVGGGGGDLANDAAVEADVGSVVGVVDPIGISWFHAHSVAKSLEVALARAAALGLIQAVPSVAVVGVDFFRRQTDAITTAIESARVLDNADTAARFVEAVDEALAITPVSHLLFPPFLGLDTTDSLVDQLTRATGVPCAEIVATEPGAAGFRVQRALEAMLAHAGIPIIRTRVRAHEVTGARSIRQLACVAADGAETTVEARAVVLATGKFIGGGVAGPRPWRETTFELPVATRGEVLAVESGASLTRESPFERQPLFSAGVCVDDSLRPLDRHGDPRYENLFAAGDVLGGHDGVADGSAMGVGLATGHAAGRNAAAI